MRGPDLVLFTCVSVLASCNPQSDPYDFGPAGQGWGPGTSTTGGSSEDGGTGTTSTTGADTGSTGTSPGTGTGTGTGTGSSVGTGTDGCGNGTIDPGEDCDTDDLGAATCESEGFVGGTLACSDTCTFDTSGCEADTCGDGTKDADEDCDCGAGACSPAQLGDQTCADFPPHTAGTLGCNSLDDCTFDTSGCYYCGDDTADSGETCDGTDLDGHTCETEGFVGGDLDCDASCNLDTSACIAPTVITECSTPNVAIPDSGDVLDTINVTDTGTITDVDVEVEVTHSFLADIELRLQRPGANRWLVRDECSGYANIDAVFDDEGDPLTCTPAPGINGNVIPEESLDIYDGTEAQGEWTLHAFDDFGAYSGTLDRWCVLITIQ
jgi:subtilisin-like proprotein convertase family protein